jgi:hypothetical protein
MSPTILIQGKLSLVKSLAVFQLPLHRRPTLQALGDTILETLLPFLAIRSLIGLGVGGRAPYHQRGKNQQQSPSPGFHPPIPVPITKTFMTIQTTPFSSHAQLIVLEAFLSNRYDRFIFDAIIDLHQVFAQANPYNEYQVTDWQIDLKLSPVESAS